MDRKTDSAAGIAMSEAWTGAEKLRLAVLHRPAADLLRSEDPAEAGRHEHEAGRLRTEVGDLDRQAEMVVETQRAV